jgi:hypothetical protein
MAPALLLAVYTVRAAEEGKPPTPGELDLPPGPVRATIAS